MERIEKAGTLCLALAFLVLLAGFVSAFCEESVVVEDSVGREVEAPSG
ncbi:MAG: hypothetical protein ACOC88_01225 [Candidatus Bipolaricaulota bacterium]|nr:hypothetical protein [Candidatus Bipolaricaulota bacterium]